MEGSKNNPEDGGHYPFTFESKQGLDLPDAQIPSEPATTPSKVQRSITPRGQLFTSLNDAHRNITSRSVETNNSLQKVSDHNVLNDRPDDFDKSQKNNTHDYQGDLDDAVPATVFGQPIVDPKHDLPKDASTFILPNTHAERSLSSSHSSPSTTTTSTMQLKVKSPGIEVTSRIKTFESEEGKIDHTTNQVRCEFIHVDPLEAKVANTTSTTNTTSLPQDNSTNTVEKIYDQYASEGYAARPSSPATDNVYTFKGVNRARVASPSGPPQRPLPGFPRPERQLLPYSENNEGEEVFDNLRKSLEPAPLRIPSRPEKTPSNPFSDTGSSIGSNHDTSSEDPFKFDGEKYRHFLHPTKEKDVSEALKRMSRGDQGSQEFLVTPDISPRRGADDSDKRGESDGKPGDAAISFPRKRPNIHGFNPTALKPIVAEYEPGEVKVVIQRTPNVEPDVEPDDLKPQNNIAELVEKHDKVFPRDDSGWVTEATSDCDTGTNFDADIPMPTLGFKSAGSSIADYSDEEDNEGQIGDQEGLFSSCEHILQHPAGEVQSSSYRLRALKDIKQQVLLPETRGCEGNGFPNNSIRLFPTVPKDTDTKTAAARTNVTRQLSNPFRRGNYRRVEPNSQFQFKRRGNAPSKYEFRDSVSEYNAAMDASPPLPAESKRDHNDGITIGFTMNSSNHGKAAEAQQAVSQFPRLVSLEDAQAMQKAGREAGSKDETPPSMYQRRRPRNLNPDQQFAMGSPSSFANEPVSNYSFEFPLLSLDEARVKLKRQRDSGETDETDPPDVRFKQSRSATITKAPSIESPIQPPTPARLRHGHREKSQDPPTPPAATRSKDVNTPVSMRALRSPLTPGTDCTPFSPVSPSYSWWRPSSADQQTPQRLLPEGRADVVATGPTSHRAMNSDSVPSYKAPSDYLSPEAKRRQKWWFYAALALSVLPFFGILIIRGKFDDSLIWLTKGEVRRLTYGQKRKIKIMLLCEAFISMAVITGTVSYVILHSS